MLLKFLVVKNKKNSFNKSALLANSEIIILDEATNQLDEKSLKYIRRTIKKNKKFKTIIIISHQKSVRQLADKAYFLSK